MQGRYRLGTGQRGPLNNRMKPIQLVVNAKDKASAVLTAIKGKISALGAGLGAWFSVKSFAEAIQGATSFEAAMSRVQAATGASTEELKQLSQAAQDIGSSTGQGAEKAAQALQTLGEAGWNAGQSLESLPHIANLASAAGIELGDAASYITQAMQSMGENIGNTASVVDTLIAAAQASGTSVENLSAGLAKIGPAAQAAGVDLQTATGLLAGITQGGIDAGRASSALSNALAQFANPASAFSQALGAAGIATDDFQLALAQMADGGPKAQHALQALGNEAGPVLKTLLAQGSGALADMRAQLQASAGSAAATAAVMGNNLADSLGVLQSTWTNLKTALTTPLLPVIKEQVDKLGAALRQLLAEGAIQSLGESMAAAFKTAAAWAREAISALDISQLAANLKNWAEQASKAFERIGQSAAVAGGIVQATWGVMAGGIHVILAAIKGVGAAITALVAQFAKAGQAIAQALSFAGLESAAQKLRGHFEMLQALAEGFGDSAVRSMQAAAASAETAQAGFVRFTGGLQASQTAAEQLHTAQTQLVGSTAQLSSTQERASAAVEQTGTALVDLEHAYKQLGITSVASLQQQAETARQAFETIKDSGTAAPDDIRRAFQKMAEAAIAANGGVADATLKAQAAQYGLAIEADASGKTIVQSMDAAAKSTEKVASSAKTAATSLKQAGGATQQLEQAQASATNTTQSFTVAILNSSNAASEYAREATRHAAVVVGRLKAAGVSWEGYIRSVAGHVQRLRDTANGYVEAMQRIDAQQKALEASQSEAAQGVEQLRQRLLQLNGTEEDIARDKARRENEAMQREIALAQLALERARVKKDNADIAAQTQELELLKEKQKLLEQVHRAEQKQRQTSSRPGASGGGSNSGGGISGVPTAPLTRAEPGISITLNANGVSDPARLARMIEPELARLATRAR